MLFIKENGTRKETEIEPMLSDKSESFSMKKMKITPSSISGSDCELGLKDDVETNWRAVGLAGVVTFLAAVENTVVGMAEWPYMHTIDPEATSAFFGVANSVSKCGHAFFAIVFSYWCYKTQTVRWPLIAGRILAFLACCLYLCVEFIPTGRRYLMMTCYLFFGIAASSSAILRVYVVMFSSHAHRSKAYAAIVVANMISIVIGPVCQLIFSSISYPGFEILPGLHFHLYSAPIWVASLTNFFSMAIIYFMLDEMPKRVKGIEKSLGGFNLETLKDRIAKLLTLNICWSLVIVCWIQKIMANLAVVTLQTITSPLMMVSFGWDGQFTVRVMSMCLGTVGILSLLVAFIFMATNFSQKVSPRVSFLFSLLISIVMYVCSYPYPNISHPLPAYNETSRSGCNPLEYDWCLTNQATSAAIFIPVIVGVMGIGLPMAQISLDTIYSRILGKIDQTVLQGAIVAAEDVVLILGPIYSSGMFSAYGQGTLWLWNGVITIIGASLWIFFFKGLKKYN